MRIDEQNNPLTPFFRDKGDGLTPQQRAAVISVLARYERAGIPKGYRDVYLDNSPAREGNEDIYKTLEAYEKTFTMEGVRIKNLYIFGIQVGTGKTTSAVALLNSYIRRRFMYYASRGETIPEVLGLFMDVNELQTKYNLATMSSDQDKLSEVMAELERYSNVEFLVVDDLATRSSTEAFKSMVHSVVNRRISLELPTIYTSNVPIKDLSSIFDSRLMDRIRDQCLTITMVGESNRGMRK